MNERQNRFRHMGFLADVPESQRYLRRLNGEAVTPLQVGREMASKARRTFREFRSG